LLTNDVSQQEDPGSRSSAAHSLLASVACATRRRAIHHRAIRRISSLLCRARENVLPNRRSCPPLEIVIGPFQAQRACDSSRRVTCRHYACQSLEAHSSVQQGRLSYSHHATSHR
jgi:hypothetical protein